MHTSISHTQMMYHSRSYRTGHYCKHNDINLHTYMLTQPYIKSKAHKEDERLKDCPYCGKQCHANTRHFHIDCQHPAVKQARHAMYDAVEETLNKLIHEIQNTPEPDPAMQFKTDMNETAMRAEKQ